MDRNQILSGLVLLGLLSAAVASDEAISDTLMKSFEDYERSKLRSKVEEELRQLEERLQSEKTGLSADESMSERKLPAAALLSADKPVLPRPPFTPPQKCCVPGFTYVDLRNDADCDVINKTPGVEVLNYPTSQTKEDCSKTALLKITFDTLTKEPCDFCLEAPYCGRRMLQIDLELLPGTRSGFAFNLGDSYTNDGYGGDANTQKRDAETQGRYPHVEVFKSDACNSGALQTFANAINSAVNHVTLYVSNQYLRVTNDQGFDDSVCSECLYALNGQADSQGVNSDLYLGLNRVVSGRQDRNGVGVCSATLTWKCPQW